MTRSANLWAGGALVVLVTAAALLSLVWTPHDPLLVDVTLRLRGPDASYWLGTDRFGRDLLSQLLVGARTTLLIGVVSVLAAAAVGTPLGVLAALGPRWLDEVLMRTVDLLLAFPTLLLAIMFGAVFGADTGTAMLAIGIASVPGFARIARSGTAEVRSAEFVLAARAAGRGRTGIAVRHVLPNIGGLVVVQGSVSFAIAVLAEAALSFLGFGTRPPTPSWGRMLQESQEVLSVEPRLAIVPAVAIAVAVLGFNLLGDGLRDRFDVRLTGRR
ncbi:peptide/nickel transport system permease protein [Crossiella equi]|uniref:Peptide/nickel transport system permease protein n=1 Tax=Crossiella equi TaxID=130796 RepID=A0ABS5AAF0_9PSEU|nr:ABC transporter permease [Crossiella equi]MBP2473267.1 peptide/nickel transport system permease protein [Crossiella equi]